mmetsp:Transcript_59349/g.145176  ORF Transcript_59349/g.145176 Transcript_59349/m.145176 type:complete len:202 (+) Transcript_59349:3621-4226(+)
MVLWTKNLKSNPVKARPSTFVSNASWAWAGSPPQNIPSSVICCDPSTVGHKCSMSNPVLTLSVPAHHRGWMQNFSRIGGGESSSSSGDGGCSKSPNKYPVRRFSRTPCARPVLSSVSTIMTTGSKSACRSAPRLRGGGLVRPNFANSVGFGPMSLSPFPSPPPPIAILNILSSGPPPEDVAESPSSPETDEADDDSSISQN